MLQGLAMSGAGSFLGGALGACSHEPASSETSGGRTSGNGRAALGPADRRFLIVVGGIGGASIIDSFLAIRQSETTAAGGNPALINTFPDAQVESVAGSPLRGVNLTGSGLSLPITPINTNQTPFVKAHKDDLMVATVETTSVNHTIAQKRSITGNNAWKGRTLQECVAQQYGEGLPLPNANMAAFGFLEQGTDESLPSWCFSQPIANPLFFSLGLDGRRGIKEAPSKDVMELARRTRDEKLDPKSVFYQTYRQSKRIQLWMQQRGASQQQIETLDLVSKLCLLPNLPGVVPLTDYGLETSPDGQALLTAFPKLLTDSLSAQAALAFLLIKYGVSVSVSLSPTFNVVADPGGGGLLTPPLAFDYSHNAHRAAQAQMWNRTLTVIDKLVTLLKGAEYKAGESFWNRSLVYVATDFGRSKDRQANDVNFGSGHDLNNGVVVVSPKANGNKVLGGVDAKTGLTYGFDSDGTPNPNKKTTEAEIFSGILGALKVDTTGSGLPSVPVMYKA